MFYPLAIPEATAFATEQAIVEILQKHFLDLKNWTFRKDFERWLYFEMTVHELRRHFPYLSSATFTHIVRSMTRAGVIQVLKSSCLVSPADWVNSENIKLTCKYLDADFFGNGKIIIDYYTDKKGRLNPYYRSDSETLNLGGGK